MVYDLQVTVRNTNPTESEGGIDFFSYILAAEDYTLKIEMSLFEVANPNLEKGFLTFRLRPESAAVFHLPYGIPMNSKSAYMDMEAISQRDIYMILSYDPTQKQVLIHETEK